MTCIHKMSEGVTTSRRAAALLALSTVLMAGAATTALHAEEWRVLVGAESGRRGSQGLAFLPNELWVHVGDTIRWTFPTHGQSYARIEHPLVSRDCAWIHRTANWPMVCSPAARPIRKPNSLRALMSRLAQLEIKYPA